MNSIEVVNLFTNEELVFVEQKETSPDSSVTLYQSSRGVFFVLIATDYFSTPVYEKNEVKEINKEFIRWIMPKKTVFEGTVWIKNEGTYYAFAEVK